jgi:DNA adenine methylase
MSQANHQLSLFEAQPSRIVNVASVPQRSPFRYPGGKTWLIPRIRQWLKNKISEFIEPFAGGGIISLTVAAEDLAEHVTMVELDDQVAAVWRTIIENDDGEWLANQIACFDLTYESLQNVLASKTHTVRKKAFQTIIKNRTHHGGILAPGSSPLKQGENGKGIRSRWYAETLKKRILDIASIRTHITFIEGDGVEVIKQNANRADAVFFIDPPYTIAGKKAGRRLYRHFELDHEELFDVISNVTGDFLMTYDNADEVRKLAERHGLDTELVAMKNTHHAEMTELLIARNLDWARKV